MISVMISLGRRKNDETAAFMVVAAEGMLGLRRSGSFDKRAPWERDPILGPCRLGLFQ